MDNPFHDVWPEISQSYRDAFELQDSISPQQIAQHIYQQVQQGQLRVEQVPMAMESYVRERIGGVRGGRNGSV